MAGVIKQCKLYVTPPTPPTPPCCSLWEKLCFRTGLALRPKLRTCKFGHTSREHSGASMKKSTVGQTERETSIAIKERHSLRMCYHLGIRNTRGTLLALLSY